MSFDRTVYALDVSDPHHAEIQRLLQEGPEEHDDYFVSGSFIYSGCPLGWDLEHDIDVVFRDTAIKGELREWLYEEFAEESNPEYENDLSLYFRGANGQTYNFITLNDEKFKSWKFATDLVTGLCASGNEFAAYLLKTRAARVDIFVQCERLMETPK